MPNTYLIHENCSNLFNSSITNILLNILAIDTMDIVYIENIINI